MTRRICFLRLDTSFLKLIIWKYESDWILFFGERAGDGESTPHSSKPRLFQHKIFNKLPGSNHPEQETHHSALHFSVFASCFRSKNHSRAYASYRTALGTFGRSRRGSSTLSVPSGLKSRECSNKPND